MKGKSGSVSIAPTKPQQMGCGDVKEYSAEIRDSIECNFLILETKDSQILLMSFDLLYIGQTLRSIIEKKLRNFFRPEDIFLNASHTHYAPYTDDKKSIFGSVDFEYLEYISTNICDEVIRVTTNRDTMTFRSSSYRSKNVSNRRSFRKIYLEGKKIKFFSWVMQPNLSDNIYPLASIIWITMNGSLDSVIWNFPCHPTSLPVGQKLSGHYVAEIRERVRKKFGAHVNVIFLQGFSGNLKPPAIRKIITFVDKLIDTIFGFWYINFSELEYSTWCNAIFEEIIEADKESKPISFNSLSSTRFVVPISDFFEVHNSETKYLTIHLVDFNEIKVLGISGEVVNQYSDFVQSISKSQILTVGCIDDTCGYIPTDKMISEGGYEGKTMLPIFGFTGFKPNFETKLKEKVSSILR
jgi:neutral ceramidase